MERVELKTATVWLEGAIGRAKLRAGAEETLADAVANIEALRRLTRGQLIPMLVDLREIRAMHREARSYYAGPECAKVVSAGALLVASPVSRIIGTFFLGLNRPVRPTGVFSDEDEARSWLGQYR